MRSSVGSFALYVDEKMGDEPSDWSLYFFKWSLCDREDVKHTEAHDATVRERENRVVFIENCMTGFRLRIGAPWRFFGRNINTALD